MKKIIIGGIIIVVIGAMIAINVFRAQESGDGLSITRGRTQSVEAEIIVRDTIISSILITGAVEEVHDKEVTSATPVEVLEVLVEKGESVKKGDKLFTADLKALNKELEQLSISAEIQTLTLEKLKTLSMGTDDTSMTVALSLAKLNVNSAERYLATQKENLEKNQSLYDNGVISKSEFESLQSSVTEAESQLASSKLNYQRSQADLSSVRKNNANSDKSTEIDVQIQQMNLDSLLMNIETLEEQTADIEALTAAPISGVVTVLNIYNGETASSIGPLVVITDIEELKIVSNIREYDIGDVSLGQEVVITGDAIGKDEAVTGKISYIAPIAAQTMVNNRQVTAIEVEMTVNDGAEYLKPGYTTECEVITSKLEDVVIASYDMLRKDDEDNDVVFVINEEGIAEERIVELGATSDFDAEVISGLDGGEQVVVNPSLSLFDGTRVEVISEEEGE